MNGDELGSIWEGDFKLHIVNHLRNPLHDLGTLQ